jgi:hypothetical protein
MMPVVNSYPPSPSPAAQPPARSHYKHGFYMCCSCCHMAVEYCACDRQQAAGKAPNDGPEAAGLAQRIKECQT